MDTRGRAAVAARKSLTAVLMFGLIAIGGCVSLRTTGAASVQDLQAEDGYKAVYAERMTKVLTDGLVFQPTTTTPDLVHSNPFHGPPLALDQPALRPTD